MRHIIYQLIIAFVVVFCFALPLFSSAQETINECCRISNKFKLFGIQFDDNCVVGGKGAVCKIDNQDLTSSFPKAYNTTETSCQGSATAFKAIALKEWGMVCLFNTIYTVTNWLFYLITIAVTLMIIYGGFTYMTSAGDPSKAAKARTAITYALIGFAVALLAKFIPSIVRAVLGVG